ncbi:unnamed protein product [Cyprideis torosa]|uniref:Uncharacterized protein n=1 Tax=Cyprideis torosa TaxID=163714 RepID=A0A7R8ZH58_9CRUS|nr:unnamed protein product [Cyprideis torosa]CAG0881821.1 unnamed protein product [Cyprideis torosa]
MAGRARGRARAVPPPSTDDGRPVRPQGAVRPGPPPGMAGMAPPPGFTRPAGRASGLPSRGEIHSAPGPGSSVSQQMQQLSLGGGNGNGAAGNGNGAAGNGNGAAGNGRQTASEVSVGRGSVRGSRAYRTGDIKSMKPQNLNKKQGTKGAAVQLSANYFRLAPSSGNAFMVHHYNVSFKPEQDIEFDRRRLVSHHRELLGNWYLFDGASAFVFRRVGDGSPLLTLTTPKPNGDNVEVTFKHVGEVRSSDYIVLQIFSILMRTSMEKLQLKLIGVRREYYDLSQEAKMSIPRHHIDLAPGYVASIRQNEQDLLMNVGVRHKVIRNDTVLDYMMKVRQDVGSDNLRTACQDLINATVITKYNNETYRIDDIDWERNPNSTFPMKDGSEVRYVDYYSKKWRVKITQMTQPLLVSRPTKQARRRGDEVKLAMLIPELCYMTGINEAMRNDFNLKREMLRVTSLEPQRLADRYRLLIRKLTSNADVMRDIEAWGLEFERDLIRFTGRNIGEQTLLMQGVEVPAGQQADWGNYLKSNAVEKPACLRNWVVIAPAQEQRVAQDFIAGMNKVIRPMRVQYDTPRLVVTDSDRTQAYQAKIQETCRGVDLVCMIFPNNKAERYNSLKKLLCCDLPIPSQVILSKTLQKGKSNLAVCTKVAGQINCKLGGALWRVQIPVKGLMICGYDAYHDSKLKGQSVGAVIASLDSGCTQYFSTAYHHGTRQEISNKLGMAIEKCLDAYHALNGAYPEKIIFYRDGVGEGQIDQVKDVEVAMLIQRIHEKTGLPPRLAFIVVSKRINTRIFEMDGRGQYMNPRPGTVVDNVITCPEFYDFFLVSQSVRQGTVCPTMYNIIEDTGLGLLPDHYQMLTYRLCHMYFNWPGTVRVPAHCQMAHKLAFLTGQSLHKEADASLSTKQYFL